MDFRMHTRALWYFPLQTILILTMLLAGLLLPRLSPAALLNADDDAALVALYNATGGASWSTKFNWSGTTGVMDTLANPPYGVTFDGSGRVSRIILGFNNLVGDISSVDLSAMTGLYELTLSGNNLSSPPAATFLPTSLLYMELNGCQLSGAFPDYSTLSSLLGLFLRNNQLSGSLPAASLLPPNLQVLQLYQNQFSGSLPDYSGVTAMLVLELSSNPLSGSLPSAAILPPNILSLYLSSNQFSGGVPDYSTLTSLINLSLLSNLLSGSLPTTAQLPAGLQYLELGTNQFTGIIPDYSGLTSLLWLSLTSNQLSGSLPDSSKLPTTLTSLYIENNQFTGTIPDYSSLPLGKLIVNNNQLDGGLPTAAQLPAIVQEVDFSTNQLSGAIPDYSSLGSLQYIYLGYNQLSGAIPAVATLPPGIVGFNFSSNGLSGTIPDYSTIASLQTIDTQYLNIQGPTPSGVLTMPYAYLTTTPTIDPTLEGTGQPAGVTTITGTGSEIGATVNLYLDGVSIVTGITVGGAGEWSTPIDLSGKTEGSYLLTATTTYSGWPGYGSFSESLVPSTTVTIEVDTTAPLITVIGPATQTVAQGSSYTDLGATVSDNIDTGLIATVTGTVDTNTVGSYILTYNVTDNAGNAATPQTRTVNVTDQTAPVITLLGSNPINVTQGDTFIDPGATVSDNVDTDLTATVTGAVDTHTIGSYTLTYNAIDTAGNAATSVTRTVNVVASSSSGGGGGGSFGWMLLLLLLVLYLEPKRARQQT